MNEQAKTTKNLEDSLRDLPALFAALGEHYSGERLEFEEIERDWEMKLIDAKGLANLINKFRQKPNFTPNPTQK